MLDNNTWNHLLCANKWLILNRIEKREYAWESIFSLFSFSHTFWVGETCPLFLVKTSSRPQPMRRVHLIYGQLVLRNSFYIRSIKLDVLFCLRHQHFNSCSVFSNSCFVLTTATRFQLWHSANLFLLISTTVFFFLRLTAQGFLLVAVIKTSKLKTINIFVNPFVLPF